MDCDYKQALQKLDELRRHKDQLTEEVRHCCQGVDGKNDVALDLKAHLSKHWWGGKKEVVIKVKLLTIKRFDWHIDISLR